MKSIGDTLDLPSENPVARMSALWRQGQKPDLRAFLAGTGRLSAPELTDVLCTDQHERWLDGQHPAVEAYFELHGSFFPGSALPIDLILGEFLARRELGESVTPDEYCRRFPDLSEYFQLHVRLYDALEDVVPATDDAASANVTSQQNPRAHAFRFPPTALPEPPGYEILGEAGRGGSGVVYKARQLSVQRLVAIKVVPPGLDCEDHIISRFHQERLLAALVTHPNLVAAYDAGEIAGLLYFVMEFVEGTGLHALISHRGPLPVAEACEVVRQAALGLQHLHEYGLVHRDIKPSNLMLTPSGVVKVIDLGLARVVSGSAEEGQISLPGQFLGTLDYMAPEQFDDCHTVDIRADIYSLGCTLYHLLAGGPPFAAFSSPYKKLKAHTEAPAPPIQEQRPDIPDRVAAALEWMLAKDRNDRFATPAEAGAALLPFANDARLPELLHGDPRHRPTA